MLNNNRHPQLMRPVRESHSHNFLYRLVSSQRFLAIIGLVFLVAVLLPLAKTYSQRRLVEREVAEVKAQIDEFENQNLELGELLGYLQSDQSLEEQARQNLNLKKPGEVVVVIENKNTASGLATVGSTVSGDSNLIKWWKYFLK